MPLKAATARFAYTTLLRLAAPIYFARLWWRGRSEPPYRTHWDERLGLGRLQCAPGAVWIHAVSLGETRAAHALIDAMREMGLGEPLIQKIAHGNWLRLLERTWGA